MGSAATKPKKQISPKGTGGREKLKRRQSMSKLKTGTSMTGGYRLPKTGKLSENYFKSIGKIHNLKVFYILSNQLKICVYLETLC